MKLRIEARYKITMKYKILVCKKLISKILMRDKFLKLMEN